LVEDPSGGSSGLSIVKSTTKHTLEVDYNVLAVEVMYKQNFIKEVPLGVTFGPSFEFPLTKNVKQEYQLVTPLTAQFSKVDKYNYSADNRTVILKDGEIDKAAGIRVGIKIGVQYELILFQRAYIVPALYYNYALTNVKSDEDWSINVIQVGCDIRWAF
jgi:hypothetical protein